MTRREFLRATASASALSAVHGLLPAWARHPDGLGAQAAAAREFDLAVARTAIGIDGRQGTAVTVDGSVPGPLLRFREGETVTLRVRNELDEPTSIHWHGLLLPFEMDGVPGVSFPGIPPGETFTYRYPVVQSGTYWYHSHTGVQEQLGHYGPLVIDPAGPDPVAYDREHLVVLGDWMFANPHSVLAKLKKDEGYSNYRRRTVGDFFRAVSRNGLGAAVGDRLRWGRMRMAPTDIADVAGHHYTYLMNGQGPETGWYGLFTPGERVRLRVINAAAMSYFNLRIPGLPMTVVQTDGQNVEPVTVDELQIAVAETWRWACSAWRRCRRTKESCDAPAAAVWGVAACRRPGVGAGDAADRGARRVGDAAARAADRHVRAGRSSGRARLGGREGLPARRAGVGGHRRQQVLGED